MSTATETTNHTVIRNWVEARGGQPSRVRDQGEGGILRIDFDPSDKGLEPIGWEEFFSIFEENDLAFLHQDLTDAGAASRFNKFVQRSSA